MSTSKRPPHEPISDLPLRSFLCSYCGATIRVGWDDPDPERCPTEGCRRPVGFGRNAEKPVVAKAT
jgi:hypothetical protein